MNQKVVEVIKSCDIDKYFELVDEYPFIVTHCRILKDDEEIFFQRALDGDISMNDYLKEEASLLKLCERIYKKSHKNTVIGFYTINSNNFITNTYAKKTWRLQFRIIFNLLRMKCLNVNSQQLMKKMVQIGCREIGTTFIYFSSEDLFICIDALRCVILTKTKEQVISYLKEIDCEYEIECR